MNVPIFLFIHQLTNILSCFHFQAICIMLLWTFVHILLYGSRLLFFFDMYLRVVLLWLTFQWTAKMFSNVVAPFYIPTSNMRGPQFLCILANIVKYLSLTVVILLGMKWYLIAELICIFLYVYILNLLNQSLFLFRIYFTIKKKSCRALWKLSNTICNK